MVHVLTAELRQQVRRQNHEPQLFPNGDVQGKREVEHKRRQSAPLSKTSPPGQSAAAGRGRATKKKMQKQREKTVVTSAGSECGGEEPLELRPHPLTKRIMQEWFQTVRGGGGNRRVGEGMGT